MSSSTETETRPVIDLAAEGDLAAMVALSDVKRRQYEAYQPRFWRRAEDANERQTDYFRGLIGDGRALALVVRDEGRLRGFLVVAFRPAPPVYDPGGSSAVIDDFVVDVEGSWPTVGRGLLEEAMVRCRARGASQVVIVCGNHDEPKRRLLRDMNYSIATEWFVRSL